MDCLTSRKKAVSSSVRRIFKRGGPRNLRILKTKRKISPLRIDSFSSPKLGEDQKKGLSNLVPLLAQNWGMPRFCILLYANYTILANPWLYYPGDPPKYAPGCEYQFLWSLVFAHQFWNELFITIKKKINFLVYFKPYFIVVSMSD